MSTPLHQLQQCGQSVWTDVISRTLIRKTLPCLITEDGITGVTANPTIFEHAISSTQEYDERIRELAAGGLSSLQVYEALAIDDVGAAADLLRPIYDRTGGKDGFVSLEVSPEIAYETQPTIEEARRFWQQLDRPNIMIKVPATPAGIPAIEQLTADGVNVNITLIFSVDIYEQVMDAYLSGLERRVQEGRPIDHIASVASFFVSRVDTLADKLLEDKARISCRWPETQRTLRSLEGKVAVANAKIAYQHFERVFSSDRFIALQQKGGQVQRPLWASTSTKNPSYSDELYVAPLIGPNSVNTMTLETIEAFRDHGTVDCGAIRNGVDEAQHVVGRLDAVGIHLTSVTDQLTEEGVEKFRTSLRSLLDVIAQRTSLPMRA
jgi:transaldolase